MKSLKRKRIMIKDILWMLLMLSFAVSGVLFTENPSYMGVVILSFCFGCICLWMCFSITFKLLVGEYNE